MFRLGSIYYRHMWRYLQAPKFLDRHFVAVDWARIIFSTLCLAVKCRAHFCATTTCNLAWVSICHNRVSIWASEAPQRPQRPLRRPSEAPLGSQFGSQRLGSQFGLGIGIIKMPRVAERQRCLIKLPLPWRDCGGPNIFLPPQCGGIWQLKYFFYRINGGLCPLHYTHSATKTVTFQPN